jgi:colanic acid/amylovoran biosynthesis glycosyltransferase
MADGNGTLPTVGFVRERGEPDSPLVAGLLEDLARHGWRARALEQAPMVGRRLDVLHVPSAGLAREWVGLARRLGARTVVSLRGDEAGAVEPSAWTGADALHVDSERLAALVRNGSRGPHTPVVIEPAADAALLGEEPLAPPAGAPLRILSVGALSWTQGYEFALAAVAMLADRGVPCEYRIVGAGPHQDAVAFARHQLGLDGRVELAGRAHREELRSHLRWASVLVDVPVLAPSSQALLDAQAAGVAVVTTQPLDRDAVGALLVPARDPEALCETLARLAADADLRTGLVRAGRARALAAPTPEAQGARWRELYRKLAAA